jgi:hypothetical protein
VKVGGEGGARDDAGDAGGEFDAVGQGGGGW